MASKSFLSTVFSGFGKIPTLKIYLQSFCVLKTHFFVRGRRLIFLTETTVHGPHGGSHDRAGPVMFCCASVHRSSKKSSARFFLFFNIPKELFYNENPNAAKTKRSRTLSFLRCIACLACCAGRISVSWTSKSTV